MEAKTYSVAALTADKKTLGLSRWVRGGLWALADQGLFTIANFLIHVLLARWLPPREYGAFTVAFTIFLLLGAFHIATFNEPMVVYGSMRRRESLSTYLDALLYCHFGFSLCGSALLLLVGASLWARDFGTVASSLFAFSFAAPFILFFGLMRTMCYVRLEELPRAAQGGGLYLILLLSGVLLLWRYELLSATPVIVVMGIASLTAGAWLVLLLRQEPFCRPSSEVLREVCLRHWRYGRWSLATYACIWIQENLAYVLLPIWGGFETSAALRALMNLLMPLLRTYAALSGFMVAAFVRLRNQARFGSAVRAFLLVFLGGAIVYGGLLCVFHRSLMHWLYQGQYESSLSLVWPLGLFLLCTGVLSVFSSALRALERPDLVFWAQAFAALIAFTFGIGLMMGWGITEAVLGLWLSGMTGAVTMGIFYRQKEQGSSSQEQDASCGSPFSSIR